MFATLETTDLATWVAVSLWGYPMMLSLHVVGLAVVVGIFAMRDLTLLGLFPSVQPSAFLGLGKLGWVGFIVNAVSGFALFASQATVFITSIPFLIKIACIVAGMVLAGVIQSRLRSEVELSDAQAVISRPTKIIASISLLLWLAAIIAGRLIAYIF
ncbi:MAG: hypothetical protein P8N94_00690 [Gammaproteobacteria bacterium]|nr:hypothetical protein [Gammaproteobacteria bacterium]MDG2336494.1 hypothetical protein [Gammaproteobacteria bacterium]